MLAIILLVPTVLIQQVALVDFLILVAMVTLRKYKNGLSEGTSKQCATLFNEYTLVRKWAVWTTMVFFGRRTLSIVSLLAFARYPLVQIGALFLFNAAVSSRDEGRAWPGR